MLHCFEFISFFSRHKRSLKACVNIHHQSVSQSSSSKSKRSLKFSRTAAAFFKKRDKAEKVLWHRAAATVCRCEGMKTLLPARGERKKEEEEEKKTTETSF